MKPRQRQPSIALLQRESESGGFLLHGLWGREREGKEKQVYGVLYRVTAVILQVLIWARAKAELGTRARGTLTTPDPEEASGLRVDQRRDLPGGARVAQGTD